jgi:hypothetical protein
MLLEQQSNVKEGTPLLSSRSIWLFWEHSRRVGVRCAHGSLFQRFDASKSAAGIRKQP